METTLIREGDYDQVTPHVSPAIIEQRVLNLEAELEAEKTARLDLLDELEVEKELRFADEEIYKSRIAGYERLNRTLAEHIDGLSKILNKDA